MADATWTVVRHGDDDLDDATADLTDGLRRSAGIRAQVVRAAAEARPGPAIHLGRDAWVDARVPDLAGLDDDGFVLERLDAAHLVIAGPSAHGTAHGVSDFLESVLGVRWLFPGAAGQVTPECALRELPDLHVRREPAFMHRAQAGLPTPTQQRWGRRLRLRTRLCGATHSLQSLLTPRTYAATHPQFFPVVDGARRLDPAGWDWHPCFCADGLPEELARLALGHFDAHPDDRCFSLAISDGAVHCECERCAAVERGRRNAIGMRHVTEQWVTCLNRAAELVAERHSDRLLGGLAYANLFDPPRAQRLHPNLVLFHTYDRHKWLHPDLARLDRDTTRAWIDAGVRLAWYDYTFGAGFPIPRIYPQTMQQAYRFARDAGVQGITAETCHNWLEAPKYYLLARLQWSPDVDADAILDEWYRLAVGDAAAPHLRAFYELWERVWRDRLLGSRAFSTAGQQWLPLQDDTCLDMVTDDDVRRGRSLLRAAVDAAGSNAEGARAELLLRAYGLTEAAVLGRLPDHAAGATRVDSADHAIAQVDAAVTAASWTAIGQRVEARLAHDEVFRRIVVPWWPGTDRRGWGVVPLWRALGWIEDDARVRRHVEAVAERDVDLAPWARCAVDVVDGRRQPLAQPSLGAKAPVEIRVVDDATRRAKEPGEGMADDGWQVCIGDDVEPFWNPPRPGRDGHVRHEPESGRDATGCLRFDGTSYATARTRLQLPEDRLVALAWVRWTPAGDPAAAPVRLELRLWSIRWSDHNPSPHVTVAQPPPGQWLPLALPVDLRPRTARTVDYRLLEIVVEGVAAGDTVEVGDVTVWPVG